MNPDIDDEVEVTFLFPSVPPVDFSVLADRLNARLVSRGLPVLSPAIVADEGCAVLSGDGLQVLIAVEDAPLGAENFAGAIAPSAGAATRAALTGIVARHLSHAVLSVCHLEDGDRGAAAIRQRLGLAHAAGAELSRAYPPLAMLWGPTNRLHHGGALSPWIDRDRPWGLFLTAQDETRGPRLSHHLRIAGAGCWLGRSLHLQTGSLSPEATRAAARAFVDAAFQTPDLMTQAGFHHDGQDFRLAHAPDGGRIDLIPVGMPVRGPAAPDAAEPTVTRRPAP